MLNVPQIENATDHRNKKSIKKNDETDGGKTKSKVGTRQKKLKSALSSQMYQPPSSGKVGAGGLI